MAEQLIFDFDAEEWRVVPGFPDYEVSSLGRLRRATTTFKFNPLIGAATVARYAGTMIEPRVPEPGGYRKTSIRRNGKAFTVRIAILVCAAFHGPKPTPLHEVAHWNGISTDDRAANLRWATSTENNEDRRRHGRLPVGEGHSQAILTDKQVLEIRASVPRRDKAADLALSYGVSASTIHYIRQGRRWSHLPHQATAPSSVLKETNCD